MQKRELGSFGERIAQKFLIKKGYKILDLNFEIRFSGKKFGEIDIVAKKKKRFFISFKKSPICFIEVKTGIRNKNFSPIDHINYSKKKRLKQLAQIYLEQKKYPENYPYQIDIIMVELFSDNGKIKINHFENAISEK